MSGRGRGPDDDGVRGHGEVIDAKSGKLGE